MSEHTEELTGSAALALLPFDAGIVAGITKVSTEKMYRRDLLAYLAFAGTREMALKSSTLARWRTHLVQHTTYSPTTINRMLSAVRAIMREAGQQDYVSSETARAFAQVSGVKVEAMEARQKPHAATRISPEEMRRLTTAPDLATLPGLRDRALLHTLATSGIRVSEAAQLTVDRIGAEDGHCFIEVKGKRDTRYRRAPISQETQMAIATWLAARGLENQAVFTGFKNQTLTSTGRPLSAVSVWRIVQDYSSRCGLAWIKPHDFRRFVATQLTRKYGLRKAQQVLGHRRVETTARYDLSELELGLTEALY